MATVKYRLLGQKNNEKQIYIYVSLGRGLVYQSNTSKIINVNDWSEDKNRPKQTKADLKSLSNCLDGLQLHIKNQLNDSTGNNETISNNWLKEKIATFFGRTIGTQKDLSLLSNYFECYIEKLPNKTNPKGQKGVSNATIIKYKTISSLISEYEKYKKRDVKIKDIDEVFQTDFVKFLSNHKKYSDNYTGRIIKFVKTVCLDAKRNGIETSNKLEQLKGFKVKIDKVYLTNEDLNQISETPLQREALQNAKDWLIIGCYIGQRVSDLLTLTKKNISFKTGVELITVTQKKTGKKVVIPMHPEVKEILEKRNGEFPYRIADQNFNLYIKEIAKIAGLDEPTNGAINNPETNRKEYGTFPKWQLVTSHICRRSFATNFYGVYPTPLLISVTGHSTEAQFLEYIGKSSEDNALQLAEWWAKEIPRKEPVLNIVKQAN